MAATLIGADVLAFSIGGAISVIAWFRARGELDPQFYLSLWPLLALFVTAHAASGLYRGVFLHPVEEFRRCTLATCLFFAVLGVSTFLSKEAQVYSRAVFLLTWCQTMVLVPLFRACVRAFFGRFAWWGQPALILSTDGAADPVVDALQRQPEFGLRPIAILSDGPRLSWHIRGVPVEGDFDQALPLARKYKVRCAIVAMPDVPRRRLQEVVRGYADIFDRLIIIPGMTGLASLWVGTTDLGGILGLEIRQKLLLRSAQFWKRVLDLVLTLVAGLLVLPLVALIAVAVKLGSPGPVLYAQQRIGRGGRSFSAFKFRTMVQDAEAVLHERLLEDARLRREWESERKLRHDPRVTPVGRLLRKTSLDELPQLWNVVKGEMSLVGPRPIVRDEIPRYGQNFSLYEKVTPGITGLWQVSGRNETGYQRRVQLDMYYVSNWSLWLDLYILARTVRSVLVGKGAY